MKKVTDFRDYEGPGWPDQKWLEPYFLTSAGRQKAFGKGNNHWCVTAKGVDGTEHLPFDKRIDIDLHIVGKPDLGVLILLFLLFRRRSDDVSDSGQGQTG
jgi:hypothetical protein